MVRPLFWLAMAVLLAVSTGESHGAIVVVQDNRSLMVPGNGAYLYDDTHHASLIPSNTVTPNPGAAAFNALIVGVGIPAQADQATSLSADSFSGYGHALTQGATDPVDIRSIFDVTFQVTAPSWFFLRGSSVSDIGGVVSSSDGFLRSLTSSAGSALSVDEDLPFEFFGAGELVPGVDYRLVLSSSEVPLSGVDLAHTDDVSWSFSFTLPEPALPLELAGLLSVGLLLRRAQKIV